MHAIFDFLSSPFCNFKAGWVIILIVLGRVRSFETDVPLLHLILTNKMLNISFSLNSQLLELGLRPGRVGVSLVYPVNEHSWNVDGFGVQLASLHYFFNLGDDAVRCLGHVLVEVPVRHRKLEVALGVSPFGLDDGEISEESFFSQVFFALEDSSLFWRSKYFGLKFNQSFFEGLVVMSFFIFNREPSRFYNSVDSRWSVESSNSGPT